MLLTLLLSIDEIMSPFSIPATNAGILQDLQGPKIRLGRFEEGPITLAKGDQFALTAKQVRCNQTVAFMRPSQARP